ncbi:Homeobox protein HD1-like protein [Drosera capensis]
MFDQLLVAHVACLRGAMPIDQLPVIDDQLSESGRVLRSYESLHQESGHVLLAQKRQELDCFFEIYEVVRESVGKQYLLMLCSSKELLQNHARVHAVEAVLACREIEHNLQNLTSN